MGFETLVYEIEGPIAVIALNRPKKLNAISAGMVAELGEALDCAEGDPGVRAIVLRGEGRAFSAGFDLEMGEDDTGDPVTFLRRELRKDLNIIMRFWHCPKPTLAAVHGYCLGSAMEMAVACDVTVAAEGCRFGAPEVNFGDGIVALILPWVIGVKQAKELLLTGDDDISSERALAMGLVNHVVAPEDCAAQAMEIARKIAGNDRSAVELTKQAINRSCEIMGMGSALDQNLELAVLIGSQETPESRAFNEVLERDGPKAAIVWRREKLAAESQKPK
jgi:enoyl-CoA hydratase/carnithine racemase